MADCTPVDQSLTTYELLDGMMSRGWCWHFANPKNTQSYVVVQPKHIVVKPDARAPPFRNYLLVSMNAAEIFADGFIDQIKHGGCNVM